MALSEGIFGDGDNGESRALQYRVVYLMSDHEGLHLDLNEPKKTKKQRAQSWYKC